MSQTASSGTTMTFRHMKIWKRLNGSGNDPVFRSPSSDSGYSDAQMFQTTGAGKGAKQLAPGRSQQQQLKQRGGRGGGTAGDGEEVRRLGGSDMSDGANKRKLFGCCSSQEMLNFETVLGFVRRKDANRIQHALRDSHFDIDTQDAVSSNTYPHSLSLSLSLFVSLPYSCMSPCLHPLYLCTFCHSLLLLLHIFVCLAMYLFLSICLSPSISFRLSLCLFPSISLFMSFLLSALCCYICMPICFSLSLCLTISVCLCLCLFLCHSVSLPVFLCIPVRGACVSILLFALICLI